MIKRFKAKRNGLPYRISKWWVAGTIYCRERLKDYEEFEVIEVNRNNGFRDAIVPLFKKDGKTYFYKVTGCYCAQGNDHIISPWSFDFQYDHMEQAV